MYTAEGAQRARTPRLTARRSRRTPPLRAAASAAQRWLASWPRSRHSELAQPSVLAADGAASPGCIARHSRASARQSATTGTCERAITSADHSHRRWSTVGSGALTRASGTHISQTHIRQRQRQRRWLRRYDCGQGRRARTRQLWTIYRLDKPRLCGAASQPNAPPPPSTASPRDCRPRPPASPATLPRGRGCASSAAPAWQSCVARRRSACRDRCVTRSRRCRSTRA